MEKKRRATRVACNEKVIFQYNSIFIEAKLLNISLIGALVQLKEDASMHLGDQCRITIYLNILGITLHFSAEVRHSLKDQVGVEFLFMDSDSKIYLKSLLDFRTANPHLISEEFEYSIHHNE